MYVYYKVYTMVSTMLSWQPNLGLFITTYLSIRTKFGWKSISIKIPHGNYKDSKEIVCVKNVIKNNTRNWFKRNERSFTFTMKVYNFRWPTIFLPAPFSYNYPSCSFLCVKFRFLNYINLMTLNTLQYI